MTYSREDVTIDYHGNQYDENGWPRERPAVNVKCHNIYGADWRKLAADVADEASDPAAFLAWWDSQLAADDDFGPPEWTFEAACENGWELLQTDAGELFGPTVKVYAEGRSSGWCVVDGLPPVSTWDAILLAKWRRFEKWAGQQVDDIPRSMVWHTMANVWEPAHDAGVRAAHGIATIGEP